MGQAPQVRVPARAPRGATRPPVERAGLRLARRALPFSHS